MVVVCHLVFGTIFVIELLDTIMIIFIKDNQFWVLIKAMHLKAQHAFRELSERNELNYRIKLTFNKFNSVDISHKHSTDSNTLKLYHQKEINESNAWNGLN